MTVLVAVKGWDPGHWVDALRARAPGRDVVVAPDVPDPAAVRYALVWKPEPGRLAGYPNLEVIFSLGAGVDHLTSDPALPALPIVRIVDPDLTMRMTEWVVLQVLLHHRKQRLYDRLQAERRWAPQDQVSARGLRVGIMGLGVLGLDAARALAGLGFPVAGWSRTPRTVPGLETFHGRDGLPAFLARTDLLVVLLPLTADTRGLIDAALIDGLAKDGPLGGPVLVNAGRGGLQDEAAIDAALRDGRLAAASLDVFAVEPLPEASPLWGAPNLTITPHVAAESDPVALSAYVMGQIEAYERGEGLANLVDPGLGY
ncbi:2-hydroxyacid dehydrogenase [Oharaeibacter diazotrophicus]|uniref:Glyoxylate/hydroxypyruvate reductase A n=1 Tax=Oharaeibacter diazotrophicus TaxID=1920512 RepID=A0A4R6R968_9HYPH|nr:glyoxylate/hydroxypyruvate reductase A [Oharaeibacter diazotrophicus]TDP82519.1 glyoxylate/hydroxypyruvate reductase A [Oharaeibacter diazotrophicus]BBE72717.1 glyoxylate/hydroxypyruvate reductase A [Pleomorphomonas sp. SM30]GLS76752.1 glyoxylate/hydroxypyruvate reductase A [Oharaeibacter diazotrophicus]